MKERNHVVIGIIKRLDSQVTTGLGAEQFVAQRDGSPFVLYVENPGFSMRIS